MKAKSLMLQRLHRLAGSLDFLLCFISFFYHLFASLLLFPCAYVFRAYSSSARTYVLMSRIDFLLLFASVESMLRQLGLLNDRRSLNECFCGTSVWVHIKQLHWCFRFPDVGECVYNNDCAQSNKIVNWKLNSILFTVSVLSGFAASVESHYIHTSFSSVSWCLSAASLMHISCRKSNLRD